MERNGLISREVVSLSPVAVQYQITPLGRTLQQPFRALHEWTLEKLPEVDAARQAFDAMNGRPAPHEGASASRSV
jgi:DNA-binding HxlR family transcriptional regulator